VTAISIYFCHQFGFAVKSCSSGVARSSVAHSYGYHCSSQSAQSAQPVGLGTQPWFSLGLAGRFVELLLGFPSTD